MRKESECNLFICLFSWIELNQICIHIPGFGYYLLSLAKKWLRLYSSVYCDWSHSSSKLPRIAFIPFPVPAVWSLSSDPFFKEAPPYKKDPIIEDTIHLETCNQNKCIPFS